MTCKLKDRCKQGETCVAHNGYDIWRCTAFKDKGVPMTNEEWLKQANTEQLAKVLLSFCQYPCEICKIQCDDGNACTYNKALNTIVEWLKQPHQ